MSSARKVSLRRAAAVLVACLTAALTTAYALGATDRLDTPEALAQRVVDLYDSQSPLWRAENVAAQNAYMHQVFATLYDPQFAKLINDNRTLASREGNEELDHDPVCQCQAEPGRIRILGIQHRPNSFANVKLASNCDQPGGCVVYTMVLHRTGGVWKIYDIIDQGGSNRAWLSQDNAEMRAQAH